MEIEQLRQLAKSKGVRNWHNKKRETLENDLGITDKKQNYVMKDDDLRENTSPVEEKHADKQDISPRPLLPLITKKPKIVVLITKDDQMFFESIGFKTEWLASLANQYGFERLEYAVKFKAFRCFKNGPQVDWIDVNDLAMMNGSQPLIKIMMKHQPVSRKKGTDRGCISLPWRKNVTYKINDPSLVEK